MEDERRARQEMSREDAQTRCVEILSVTRDLNLQCQVEKFGAVKGGRRFGLSYQLQSYLYEGGRVTGGAAVLRENSNGTFTPIAAAFEDPGARYDEPELIESPAARWLLIQGTNDGTSHPNISSLFIYDGGRIRDIDTQTWLIDLLHTLPGDLEVRRGIFPDYRKMTAQAMLVHPERSCCEGASIATIGLGLAGRRIVLRGVTFRPYRGR